MCETMTFNLQSSLDVINSNAENINRNVDITLITDAFRFLRNSCGTNPQLQKDLLKEPGVLQSTKKILFELISVDNASQERILCLQVGLQFVANLIVNNAKNQEHVWCAYQDLITHCLKFKDSKVRNYCAMILYNIFLGKPEYLNELTHSFEGLIELTMEENTSEFALYTLELFVLKSNYIEKYYEALKPEYRLLIMEVIKNLITEQRNHSINSGIIKFYSDQFTKKSDCILKTCESYIDSLDPVETVKILDLLVAFSSDDQQCYLDIIQKQTSLLINCIMLLKNVHSLSKQSNNNFSMLSKLSEFNEEKDSIVREHPVFGFKCSLIRLIGNFCWKNSINQNKVRELECISILLDCCNIDARNPFIIQWCILAIRNICEKNYENQQFIASMSKEGKVDTARLKEIGITLNSGSNADAVCIAPLNTLGNHKNF